MKTVMRLKTTFRFITIVWLLMFFGKGEAQSAKSIVINEIMASNAGVVMSPAYNFDSWVEFYNPTEESINLSGMYLSDNASNLKCWKMPADIGTIPAKGFLVVWLGSDDIKKNQAPFKLDCDGGTIYLSNASGQVISQDYPKAMSRTAWARKTDGGSEWSWTANPTPGATNITSVFATERLAPPVVSVGSKIFTGSLQINVEIPDGTRLIYTTDGSVPTSVPMSGSTSQEGAGNNEPTWTNWITNGDCEGDDATCFVSKDGDDPETMYNAIITDGVGVDGSRGIKIHSVNNPINPWDTQFFVYTPGHVWQTGEKYRFRMSIRADKPTTFSVECHSTPGNYINGPMLAGNYDVDENWQDIEYIGTVRSEQTYNEGLGNINLQTIAFTLNNVPKENMFYFDNLSWEVLVEEKEETGSWTEWIINGDCEGSDATCLFSKDGNAPETMYNAITDGVGIDGSRGIRIHSVANASEDWQSQFFITTPDHSWRDGERYHFRMMVRADKAAHISAQSHTTPGNYIWYYILDGGYDITTEWQEIDFDGYITHDQVYGHDGVQHDLQTIAFNLNEDKSQDNNFYFDNIVWESFEGGNTNDNYEIVVRDNPGKESTTGRFTVSKTTNYVFRLFKDGYLPSVPVTRSYIKKDKDFTIPIVSIVGDDKYYNDPMWGIDVDGINGKPGNNRDYPVNWNMAWDRPVNFSFISPTDGMLFNQDVMTSVSGGWSRQDTPRSFKLKSNKVFDGLNHLDYAFFPQKPYIRNKALLVRNGGNDGGRFMDPAMTTIVHRSGIDLDVQSTLQVAEYVNGEFRGVLNLRETNNDKFVYANWGYDDEEIDYFENFQFTDGTDEAWNHLMELSERVNNNGVYDEIKTLLDIDEFTNYMAVEMFLGNSDWPNNNVKGYRSRDDGRFRFILFDLDQIFNRWCPMDHLSTLDRQFANEQLVVLLRNLLGNDVYRKKFIDTFCIIAGSVFERDRVTTIVDEIAGNMRPMLQLEGRSPDGTADEIKYKMQTRLEEILGPQGQLEQYQPAQIGGLQRQTVTLSADAPDAHITINGIDVPYGDFKGYLFQPIKLEAKAPAGYRFAGWSIGAGTASNCLFGISDTWKYYDKGELASNWNTSNFNDNAWASGQAPLGYTMDGVTTTVSYGSDSNQKNPTTYFRKTVSLNSTPSSSDIFQLKYQVDDGFIVYVNGQEAGRFNMPDGDVNFNSFSSSYAESTPLKGTINLSPSLFKSGSNLIAVEIHNNSYTSSDQFWAAELYTTVGTASEGFVSTESVIDLPTDATDLIASFTKLSDEEQLAQGFTPLRVNEVSAGNTIYVNEWFKHNDWFEIYNTTDTELDVAGLYVSDDEDNPLKYQIPTGGVINTIIPAGGHRIVWADEMDADTQLHTTFKLKNDDDNIVLVCSSDDFVANNKEYFDKHPEMKDFADGLVYSAHNGDQSVGRYPDGGKSLYKMIRPTIERPNTLTSVDSYLGEDNGLTNLDKEKFILELAEGWNWMSHPLVEPIAASKLSAHANRIVGKENEAIRDSKLGMTGSLKELETGNLYKVKMQQADTYTGKDFFCEDGRPIMLLPGWNWIGYTVNGQQSLRDALADYMAEEGDKIMGPSGFATYANGAWQGDLSTLETGKGYMFYTKQAKTLMFKSPSVKVNLSRLRHKTSHAARTRVSSLFRPISKHAYPNVMGVIAEVQKDDEKVEADRFTLYAYDADDECRGEGKWKNGIAWLTLYGNGGETLSFRAVDLMDGTVYTVRETISFVQDITGSVNQPFVFTLGKTEDHVTMINGVPVAPAPSDIDGYYNLNGTRISFRTPRRGIYLVKYKDGSFKKIIVK